MVIESVASATSLTTSATTTVATPTWVTLELTSASPSGGGGGDRGGDRGGKQQQAQQQQQQHNDESLFSVRKMELNDNTIRLIVSLPSMIDADEANLTVALILEQLELIQHHQDQQNQQQQQQRSSSLNASAVSIVNVGSVDGAGATSSIPTSELNQTAALSSSSSTTIVILERLKIQGIQFTPDGVNAMNTFLSSHASTIKHVSLKDMYNVNIDPTTLPNNGNCDSLESILSSFVRNNHRLEVLNLSDNRIPPGVWKHLQYQKSLRQLILDYVIMDDYCLIQMSDYFYSIGYTIEELYVVLLNIPKTKQSLNASNSILRQCCKLSSLRWAIKDSLPSAKLPWMGLAEMSTAMYERQQQQQQTQLTQQQQQPSSSTQNNQGGLLQKDGSGSFHNTSSHHNNNDNNDLMNAPLVGLLHLVMDGGTIGTEIVSSVDGGGGGGGAGGNNNNYSELDYLCIALANMTDLHSIKLRSVGIKDDGLTMIGQAFVRSSPPLESIDFSRNQIQTIGIKNFVDSLINNNNIMKNIQTIILDKNYIDNNGCRIIHEIFSFYSNNPKLDIKIDLQNPIINYNKVCYNIAFRKSQLDKDYQILLNETIQLRNDIKILQQQQRDNNINGNGNNGNNQQANETIRVLQEEVGSLTEERNTLVKAFTLLNSTNANNNNTSNSSKYSNRTGHPTASSMMEENQQDMTSSLLERISLLENALSNNNINDPYQNNNRNNNGGGGINNSIGSNNNNNVDMYRTPVTPRHSYSLPTGRNTGERVERSTSERHSLNDRSVGGITTTTPPTNLSRGVIRSTSHEVQQQQQQQQRRNSPKHSNSSNQQQQHHHHQLQQQQQQQESFYSMKEPNNSRRQSGPSNMSHQQHSLSPSPRRRETMGIRSMSNISSNNNSSNMNHHNINSSGVGATPRPLSRDTSERWSNSPSLANTPNSTSSGSNSGGGPNNNPRRKTLNNQSNVFKQHQQTSASIITTSSQANQPAQYHHSKSMNMNNSGSHLDMMESDSNINNSMNNTGGPPRYNRDYHRDNNNNSHQQQQYYPRSNSGSMMDDSGGNNNLSNQSGSGHR